MDETSNLTLYLIGLAIGVGVALAGGLVEYLLHLRRDREPRFGMPGCIVYVIGGLILGGIAAVIVSLIYTGSIGPALIMGVGVMTGFYGGFSLLVGLWFLIESLRPAEDSSTSSDSSLP